MPNKKRVASTYLRYVLIAVGVLLIFTLVRQIGGVLPSLLLVGVPCYALNPLIYGIEAHAVPRPAAAVSGVFVIFAATVLLAALFLILQQLEANILVSSIIGGITSVHRPSPLVATLAVALYGIAGAVFAAPIVAMISSSRRYLRESSNFERRDGSPFQEVPVGVGAAVPGKIRAAIPAGKPRVGRPGANSE